MKGILSIALLSVTVVACADESGERDTQMPDMSQQSDSENNVTEPVVVQIEPPHLVIAVGEDHPLTVTVNGQVVTDFEWGGTTRIDIVDSQIRARSVGEFSVGIVVDGSEATLTGEVVTPDWIDVSAGMSSTCAVNSSGEVFCFGRTELAGNQPTLPISESSPTPMNLSVPASKVAVADSSVCALGTNGYIYCRGQNQWGELGDGTWESRNVWQRVPVSDAIFTDVVAGSNYYCALSTDGAIYCWGTLLSSGIRNPLRHAGRWKAVTGGDWHVCAIDEDSKYTCWGHNAWGQLGNQTIQNTVSPDSTYFDAEGDQFRGPFTSISAGRTFTCALMSDDVYCWGNGDNNVLGHQPEYQLALVPSRTGITNVEQLNSSFNATCAILKDKRRLCWGLNDSGVLGNGVFGTSGTPKADNRRWSQIDVGMRHACGITIDGKLWCWGADMDGQVGTGRELRFHEPQHVGTGYKSVAAGGQHTCAVRTNGSVECWGSNTHAQLGIGNLRWNPFMATVGGLFGVDEVYAGENFTCAMSSGQLSCWGDNVKGQVGIDPQTAFIVQVPQAIAFAPFLEVALGGSHVVGLTDSGWFNWGYGLGFGGHSYSTHRPQQIVQSNFQEVIRTRKNLTAGALHTCAIVEETDGAAVCVGADSHFRLGIQYRANNGYLPGSWESLSAGFAHSCGIRKDGTTACFGDFFDGNSLSNYAREIAGTYEKLASGGPFACGISQGVLTCWGANHWGNLGVEPSNGAVNTIQLNASIDTFTLGWRHACAISGEDLWCWGDDSRGQLGIQRANFVLEPTLVSSPPAN